MTSTRVPARGGDAADPVTRLTLRREKVALATAVVGLAAALSAGVFGVVQKGDKDAAETSLSALRDRVDVRDRAIGDLESEVSEVRQALAKANADNRRLQARNAAQGEELELLRSQVEAAASPGAAGAAGTQSGVDDPEVRKKGVVKLVAANPAAPISLGVPAEASWNATFYSDDRLYVGRGSLSSQNLQIAKLGSATASYAACSSRTTFDARSTMPLEEFAVGSYLCARVTSSDVIAALRVVGVEPSQSITFDVTTWETT